MTTHIVEIRHRDHSGTPLSFRGDSGGWFTLTRGGLSRKDAEIAVAHLDPVWEFRIQALGSSSPATLVDVLSRLGAEEDVLDRARRNLLPVEEGLNVVRRFLFGAFESVGHCPRDLFPRWERVAVKHASGCKGAKAAYKAEIAEELGAAPWLIRTEMERRIVYLNDHVIPQLGMEAHGRTLPARIHRGWCAKCKRAAEGLSIAVEITWGEHALVREYDLGGV